MFVTVLTAAASLWVSLRLTVPTPPTVSIPRGEVPRNVRPWTPPAPPTTTATTHDTSCGPKK